MKNELLILVTAAVGFLAGLLFWHYRVQIDFDLLFAGITGALFGVLGLVIYKMHTL